MLAQREILEIIRDLLASPYAARLSVKEITEWFVDRHGEDYDRKVTAKWIGSIIRKKLQLKTQKSHGVFVVPLSEMGKLDRLYEKFGIDSPSDSKRETRGENAPEEFTDNQKEPQGGLPILPRQEVRHDHMESEERSESD